MSRGIHARILRAALAGLPVVAAVTGLAGCVPVETGPKIALLLPESKTTRYESVDRPYFEARIAELGEEAGIHYQVLYSNADQDAARQQSQAEAALTSGASVIVLDPVDSSAAVSIVRAANAAGVPVIAYDRIVNGGDLEYYVSFENETIGELQGQALVEALDATGMDAAGSRGGILMVNGSPTDGNSALFKTGAHRSIDASDYEVLAEYDTPDWSPDKAQEWVAGQITQFGDRIIGVYAANDGTAGGAISAFRAANVPIPIVTGQDSELAGIQRIVAGDQYMTIYKPMIAQARLAAELAIDLLNGKTLEGDIEFDGTPATLLEPVVVTVDNIMETVVADGLYTVDQICTDYYESACEAAGLR
jgi:D-xylose transport system substrate-binding protein